MTTPTQTDLAIIYNIASSTRLQSLDYEVEDID